MLSDSTILKHIARQPKRAAGFKQLIRELGLHGEDRTDLNNRLQNLADHGQLIQIDSDRYALPQAAADNNLVAGRLTMHRDGFGFVIPDAKALSPEMKARLTGDIFIAPHLIGNAMHGDRVLADISAIRPDGRAEGRIVRSVARAHPTVVGVFHRGSRGNYVKPIDTKITQEIVIPPGMEILDVGIAPAPASGPEAERPRLRRRGRDTGGAPALRKKSVDRVLGEEAARRAEWDDLEGVVVDVEITDWPSSTQNPRGRVIEILGREDDFGVDVEITIRKFHLPHHFPAETLEEAQAASAVISAHELGRRRDFRALPIV
ncbi:MAG: ribonuclease R, partial [Candidatus Sulfotelmatobacter sp.]